MYNTFFGQGAGPVSIILCTSSAQNISQCDITTSLSCTHSDDAGLRCAVPCYDGQVRLTEGTDVREGRVEICSDGNWSTVCDNLWNEAEAKIVCQQLGYPSDGECRFHEKLCIISIHSLSCILNYWYISVYRCSGILRSLLWPGN